MNAFKLSVVMLNVIMPSVVAPFIATTFGENVPKYVTQRNSYGLNTVKNSAKMMVKLNIIFLP
jgi:hypothetical protein